MDESRTTIDLKRLAAEVSVQHGIRVDPDDPMMAVVTLNRLVFEQAVGQVLERVQESVRDFETAADKVQVRAGAALAQEVRDCGDAMKQETAKALEEFRRAGTKRWADTAGVPSTRAGQKWIVLGLALAIFLFGLGVWVAVG
jgi:CHASE3 domain sensor protein